MASKLRDSTFRIFANPTIAYCEQLRCGHVKWVSLWFMELARWLYNCMVHTRIAIINGPISESAPIDSRVILPRCAMSFDFAGLHFP